MGLRGFWRSAFRRSKVAALVGIEQRTLDAVEREKLLQVIKLGCPSATAGKFVGLTREQLDALVLRDEELMREVLRAEAEAEVRHMGNVHKAANDEKNWRTSVWWLERHGVVVPEIDPDQPGYNEAVMLALEKFANLIVDEIPDVTRRQSLMNALLHVAAESTQEATVIDVTPTAIAVGGTGVSPVRSADTACVRDERNPEAASGQALPVRQR
jgi:hypothetical protein